MTNRDQKAKPRKAHSRERVDVSLVKSGLAPSRERAEALILAGKVWLGQQRVLKPGTRISSPHTLRVEYISPWVSRSAGKLLAALHHFAFPVADKTVIDVGSSTGGFSQVLLKYKAHKVFAVDVGSNLLHAKVKNHPNLVAIESCNARYLNHEHGIPPLDGIVVDVSFIRLQTLLPAVLAFAKPQAWLIALIKPQFQVQRAQVGRAGIIKNIETRQQACLDVKTWLVHNGWNCHGLLASPVRGKTGNQEFLIGARNEST